MLTLSGMDTSQPGDTSRPGAEPGSNSPEGNGPEGGGGDGRLDPTKMINQPALRQSNGGIWIVMGGLFLAVSLVPFGALIFAGSGRSTTVAAVFAAIITVLYAALVTMRLVVAKRIWRLRIMAACMISMAGFALIGMWLCSLIENAAVSGA